MKHFTIAELCRSEQALRQGIDNTPPSGVTMALTALADNVLDPLREAYGKPIRINSGYRSLKLNAAVGGAATSQHLRGQAADLDAGSRAENQRLYTIIRDTLPFDQLIDESNYAWLHVSYCEGRNRKQLLHL